MDSDDHNRVVFVQEINGVTNQGVKSPVVISDSTDSKKESKVIVGDIMVLREVIR